MFTLGIKYQLGYEENRKENISRVFLVDKMSYIWL